VPQGLAAGAAGRGWEGAQGGAFPGADGEGLLGADVEGRCVGQSDDMRIITEVLVLRVYIGACACVRVRVSVSRRHTVYLALWCAFACRYKTEWCVFSSV